jgi:hypothetical protein
MKILRNRYTQVPVLVLLRLKKGLAYNPRHGAGDFRTGGVPDKN